jgi:ubiquitin carboxyl-terminal hydrolase 47
VDTKSLTKSFGWQSAQSFEQHDTQEFCRVLFDAIEQSFAIAGDQCTTIKDLYEGLLVSYVKCAECGYESNNIDKYLDLSLPIKNNPNSSDAGLVSTNKSLEMALENFMRPENLDGDNQY